MESLPLYSFYLVPLLLKLAGDRAFLRPTIVIAGKDDVNTAG
jgi:hypothetical protein